jgi:hypothetical protein
MDFLKDYWEQVVFVGLIVVLFTRMRSQIAELRKDVDDMEKRNTFIETTKLRASSDAQADQITALWDHINKIRDMVSNGFGSKK